MKNKKQTQEQSQIFWLLLLPLKLQLFLKRLYTSGLECKEPTQSQNRLYKKKPVLCFFYLFCKQNKTKNCFTKTERLKIIPLNNKLICSLFFIFSKNQKKKIKKIKIKKRDPKYLITYVTKNL